MNADALHRGRSAFDRHAWLEAFTALTDADAQTPLEPADLEHLGMAAYLLGKDSASTEALMRAHHGFLASGDRVRAARCAFWLGFGRTESERARASGWIAKARRMVAECGVDCVERGYLMLPTALEAVARGDIAAAGDTFAEAARIAEQFDDLDLLSLARSGRARVMIRLGDRNPGVALLDEVMVGVTAGEVSPAIAGTIYCSVLEACFEMCDMGRAQEWTGALGEWCAAQPDMVAYRGHCLVRRGELLLLHGGWAAALDEARQACERLTAGQAGAAFYLIAELHRLRGEIAPAETAYARASDLGRSPQPGLALLRLAQGRADAARAGVCAAGDNGRDRRRTGMLLSACAEIQLASGDLTAARQAVDDLAALACSLDTPFVHALAAQAAGALALAEGQPAAALASIHAARTRWRMLEMPYDAARATVLAALASRALGDPDTAALELESARRVFTDLGARPDLERLDRLTATSADAPASRLTAREVEVLRLVAAGQSNRGIAESLAISEKTVARHLSNIFNKLDVSSRTAATAYAFRHGFA